MSQSERPVPAFILSLVGGVLMLVGGAAALAWALVGPWTWWRGMMMPWMMMWWMPWLWVIPVAVGIASGAVMTIGAILIYVRPEQSQMWGVLILIFSIVGLIGMGGFIIGSVLGLIGGILALTWRHEKSGADAR